MEMYRYLYGDSEDRIRNMCLYYDLVGGQFKDSLERMQPYYDRLYRAVFEWKKIAESGGNRSLQMTETPSGLLLLDSRPCMVQPFTVLTGLKRQVFLACDSPKSLRQLTDLLKGEAGEEEILATAEELAGLNFIARLGSHYISLALPTEKTS